MVNPCKSHMFPRFFHIIHHFSSYVSLFFTMSHQFSNFFPIVHHFSQCFTHFSLFFTIFHIFSIFFNGKSPLGPPPDAGAAASLGSVVRLAAPSDAAQQALREGQRRPFDPLKARERWVRWVRTWLVVTGTMEFYDFPSIGNFMIP